MANKIYQLQETAITFKASGGDATFTPTSLATAAGRQSAYYDLGTTTARARRFLWRAWLKPGGTRVVGEVVEVYLSRGDGTHYDNDDGTTDIAVSARDKLRNVLPLGAIQIDENAAVEMGAAGTIEIWDRYVAVIFWNATANTLSATAGDFGVSLTPIPDEVQ